MSRGININSYCGQIRQDILRISYKAQIGHIGSAFSIVEILTTLYFSVMNIDPKRPDWEERDVFILSKGHAGSALFCVLYRRGFIGLKELNTFCMDGSKLMVHPEWNGVAGVEFGTGSLGHGLPVGVGMAYGSKIRKLGGRVFVLVSDSEMGEGSNWEAALFAAHHKLDNLVVVIDYNKTQALGKVDDILSLEPLERKWDAFNFDTSVVDGHNTDILRKELGRGVVGKPRVVIAKTVIGKGVSFMEGDYRWHYYNLTKNQYDKALKEVIK